MVPVVLRAAAVIVTGIWAGILFGDWRGATLVRPALPDMCFVHFQQGLHQAFVPMMRVLLVSGAVLSAIAAWGLREVNRTSATLFGMAGLGLVSVAAITVAVNIPINNAMMTWSVASPPADMRQIWLRWEQAHAARTLMAVGAFALQCVALSLLSLGAARATGATRAAA